MRRGGGVRVLAVVMLAWMFALGACVRPVSVVTDDPTEDDAIRARVETALASASDVRAEQLSVEARAGVVTLTGRVASGTEQQSVGAIVRAIPGVEDVRFALEFTGPSPGIDR